MAKRNTKKSKPSNKSKSPKAVAEAAGATGVLEIEDLNLEGADAGTEETQTGLSSDDGPGDDAEPANPETDAADQTVQDQGGDDVPLARGFEVYDVDVDDLTLGDTRMPTDEAVAEMIAQIKANGLDQPVLMTKDYKVIDGNTRLLAYRKMGRKQIPCHVAFNSKTGAELSAADKEAAAAILFKGLAANVVRSDMTPNEIAERVEYALKNKLVETAKEFSIRSGIPYPVVQRSVAIHQRGSKKLHAALKEGKIAVVAASKLVAGEQTHTQLDKTLDMLMKASEDGNISTAAASKSASSSSSRRSGRHGKAGRKKQMMVLGEEALKTSESGVTATLRRAAAGDYIVNVGVIVSAKTSSFKDFDLVREVQKQLTKLTKKDVQAELESIRSALEDQAT